MSSRSKWTKEDNICLLFCWYRSIPGTPGAWKRLERLWEDAGYPHKPGKALASQFRSIIKSSTMVHDTEIMEIRTLVQSESPDAQSGHLPVSLSDYYSMDTFMDLTVPQHPPGPTASPSTSSSSQPTTSTTCTSPAHTSSQITSPTSAPPSQPPLSRSQRISWSRDMNTLLIQLHWTSEPECRGVWN